MKRIAIALFAAAGLAVSAAHANHDSRVTVRGSVTIGNPAPTVVYAPAPAYTAHAPVYVSPTPRHYVPARGYWKEIMVKTWVPERHCMSRDRWGRPIRVIEPGYFTYRPDRVWVDTSHGHHPHGNAYGYHRR